jgi:hypothetical protein
VRVRGSSRPNAPANPPARRDLALTTADDRVTADNGADLMQCLAERMARLVASQLGPEQAQQRIAPDEGAA